MEYSQPYAILVLLVLSFSLSECSPKIFRDDNICGNPICTEPLKFGFHNKTTYRYNYKISTSTRFDGAGTNSSNLNIAATVKIKFKTPCEGLLEILNAEISYGADQNITKNEEENEFFNSVLSAKPLRFFFNDGTISQICPNKEETIWGLNIKRGILSSFQNTMERFDIDQHSLERDVNGDCLVGYYFKMVNGTTLIIDKKLDLPSCVNRYQIYSIIPLTPYIFQKKYHKYTPMNSFVSCTQHIDHKVFTGIFCEEEHAYQPFYNQTNGAKTVSKSELTLLSEEKFSFSDILAMKQIGLVEARKNLLYDHKRSKRATHDNLFECKKQIILLCELHTVEFQPKYPDVFNRFIHIARDLSTEALTRLYKEAGGLCDTGRKHMLDAIPYIRSRASVKVMTEAVLKKEIPSDTINEWMLAMAFHPRPDYEIIESVSKLMEQTFVDNQTLFSVSTMVHAFCAGHEKCGSYQSVYRVLETLELMFNSSCTNYKDLSKAIVALKAIGNAGVLTQTMEKSLKMCMMNEKLVNENRLAAIAAHRRLPCGTNLKDITKLYLNQTNNEEIRIAAFLQLVRCPSYSVLKEIKKSLEIEEYNQVGSFVWSHLKNQMTSSEPSRVEIQAMLQDQDLKNKFNKDIRYYSRSYESSFYLNKFGLGGFYETFVIFTHNSYLPRSIMFNFTIDVFGESINIYEITFSLAGLEPYAEKLFYGDAAFSKESFAKVMKMFRVIRSAPNALKTLIDSIPFKKIIDQIKIGVSIKMFGNELKYYTIQGHDEFLNLILLLNPLQVVKDFLSGQEIKFDRSAMLIDTSYITPMSTGIPVKLNTIGTAAINLNVLGYMNSTKDSNFELTGKLTPSIGVNIEGSMEVDTFVAETGVKFKGSVFTSTALEGVFTMNSYELIKVSFNLPLSKSEIFHAETQLMLISNDEEIILSGVTAGRKEKNFCTWSILDDTIGLRLCATTILPNSTYLLESPLFLLSGPLKFAVALIKSDPTATTYIVEYKLDRKENKTLVILKFETPGSKTNRGMKAVIDLDTQSQNLTLAYQSSLSKVEARGFYRNTKNEKLVNFALDINGKKHIDIQAGVTINEGKYGNTYLPKILFAINGKKIVSLSGSVKWIAKKGISQCHVELDFQTSRFTTAINGGIRLTDASFAMDFKIDYKFEGGTGKFETVRVELKIDNRSSKFLKHYNGRLMLESTAYPEVNMITSFRYQKTLNHIDWHVELITNPMVAKEDQLMLTVNYQLLKVLSFSKMNVSTTVVRPNSDINIKLQFAQITSSSNSSNEVIVQYATGKSVIVIWEFNIPMGLLLFFDGKFSVTLPGAVDKMVITGKILEKIPNEYDLEFFGTWFSGHSISLKGSYFDKTTLVLTNHILKLLARSELFSDVLLIGRYLDSDEEYKTELQAEHDKIKYGITFKHATSEPGHYNTFGEVVYDQISYSFTSYLDSVNRKANLEIHFDRFRDIHVVLRGLTNSSTVDGGLDLKWDANRDPSQKITVSLLSNSYGDLNYDGKCVVEYPGRVINSYFDIKHYGVDYILAGNVHWSIKETIRVYLHGIYDLPNNGIAKFNGKLDTPFKKFEQLSLGYELKFENQKLKSNGSLIWQKNERVDVEVSYNYGFEESSTLLSFLSVLNSTIPEINPMQAVIRYSSFPDDFSADLIIQTSPSNTLAISGSGSIFVAEDHSQYNGSFSVMTPFAILKKAGFMGELNIYPNHFVGNLRLIGNGKKYITVVRGQMTVLSESVLNFHIEMPFERYKTIHGKFSFSASNKTILANLISSTPILDSEIIYFYESLSNFNLKLKMYTAITIKNNLLIVGKINSDTVDARFLLNSFELGLVGRSHYTSWKDIDYSLKIYTPIEGYHRGAAMAKMILEEKVDFEASVSLAEKKVGLKVQAMVQPDDKFAVPYTPPPPPPPKENETAVEEEPPVIPLVTLDEIYVSDVYWRGVFQLNTPMYPTVHGILQINRDVNDYNVFSYVSFPFLQFRLKDDLTFIDLLNIKNNFFVITSCYCFPEANSSFSLEGMLNKKVVSSLEVNAFSYGTFYKGKTQSSYQYISSSDDPDNNEGLYYIQFEIETPLKFFQHSLVNGKFALENPLYSTNITFEMNGNSVVIDGNLEADDNYFVSEVEVKINSSLLTLPRCRITLHKDFTELEKKLELGLGLPNDKGDALVTYGIGGLYLFDAPRYMKYGLEIITPYPAIGVIKGGLEYSGNTKVEDYRIETYLRYRNKTELKAICTLHKLTFGFRLDSTFEGFEKINIEGDIKNENGMRTLDTFFSDKEYRMKGRAKMPPSNPIVIELRLYKTETQSEIVSLYVKSVQMERGYDINAVIEKGQHKINIQCYYVLLQQIGKKVDLVITSSIKGYEALTLNGIFLNKDFDLMIYKIDSNIKSKLITTAIELRGDILLKDKGGIFRMYLNNPKFRADVAMQWMVVWFELLAFNLEGKGSYGQTTKEVASHLHFWNVDNDFQETSLSVDVNYNNKDWWLCTNATLLWPSWNNLRLMSFVVLPHKMNVTHTVLGKLFYKKDFTYITHVIKYIKEPKQFDFITMSEVSLESDSSSGQILLKTGKHRIFDNFKMEKIKEVYEVRNVLQSTNMEHDLTVDINYEYPKPKRLVRLSINYPIPKKIVNANVNFTSVNNFNAEMNFSTPFKAFPFVNALVNLVTTKPFYQRFMRVKWTNKTAIANYTHVSELGKGTQLTDGNVFLEFPLTSIHRGHLNYKYNSTEIHAIGRSFLKYNNETIMSGNYTRNSVFSDKSSHDIIEITVNNSYAPAGIIYDHKNVREFPYKVIPVTDLRHLELFKLNDKDFFHFTGEYEVQEDSKNKMVTVRGFNKDRMVKIQTFTEGDSSYVSSANVSLKPDVWFGSGFKVTNKHSFGKLMTFNISFPRRHFEVLADYDWNDSDLLIEITLEPNKYKNARNVFGSLNWHKERKKNSNDLIVTIKHASFDRDIIFHGHYSRNKSAPLNLTVNAEYSKDPNKKLNVDAIVLNLSRNPKVFYTFNLYGSHPASRLKILGFGHIKAQDSVAEINKNITYKRGYNPVRFYYTNGKISTKEKFVELERKSHTDLSYLKGKYGRIKSKYYLNCTIVNGETTKITSDLYFDIDNCKTALSVNFTPNASEQLLMDGYCKDYRHAQLNVWRTYDEIEINDITYLTTLNHSRMLTSVFLWRTDIKEDIKNFLQTSSTEMSDYAVSTANFWTNYIKDEAIEAVTDVWLDAKPIVQDFLDDMSDVKSLEDDMDWVKGVFKDAYYQNEFYMKDIYNMYLVLAEEMAFKDKMAHVPKIFNELYEVMGETGETMRKSILFLVETIKKLYDRTIEFMKGLMTGETINQMSQFIRNVLGKYDKVIKDMQISFTLYVEELWVQATEFMTTYWVKSLMSIEPTFIQFLHHIEAVFWDSSKKALEFLYEKQSELLKNSVFTKNSNFTKDLDNFYEDLTKNDFFTNLKKYLKMVYDIVTEKYFAVVPFGKELNEIGSEIVGGVSELNKLPFVTFTADLIKDFYVQAEWLYNYLNLSYRFQRLIPIIYDTVYDLTHTALDNEMINHQARTKFIFEPSRGRIILEQKLPVPWHAFNESPNYEEIAEYKMVNTIQKFLSPTNKSFASYYYRYAPYLEPEMIFPPFDTQALIIGNRYVMTFDKVNYQFSPHCSYLLANDFMQHTFSLVLRYVDARRYFITILLHKKVINIDLLKNELHIEGVHPVHLPLQLNDTFITATEGVAIIESKKGFILKCNFKYDVCMFKVSGWYFGKTAGLLGTIDNEQKTDFMTPSGNLDANLTSFVRSWGLGSCYEQNKYNTNKDLSRNSEPCNNLFNTKLSNFAPCFSIVNPKPFHEMCLNSIPQVFDDEICTAAHAYIKACKGEHIPLKIPSSCIECLVNDVSVDEGDTLTLKGNVLHSTDVVFIMEAKECNQYMREKRLVSAFVTILTKELASVKLFSNRFAVVTYGGNGIFDKPRSVLVNNNIFTTEKIVPRFFENIKSGNGNSDIFGALKFATELRFRPGVSKTFILIPCSDCDLLNMTVEYSVLHEEFLEKNITLHVLMNADFDLEKLGVSKMFYGLDSDKAYTKNDYQDLKGDMELRSQIKLTKSMMGYCTTLALQTNGTIFTGKRMGSENLALVKKFCNVFARRIAASAHPDPCQKCECGSDDNGIEIVECTPCMTPTSAYSEVYFKENGTSFFQQAFEQFGADDNYR